MSGPANAQCERSETYSLPAFSEERLCEECREQIRPTLARVLKDTPEYRQHYNWGWRYSARESATLDYVDSKYGISHINSVDYHAALDGYLDYAAGRAKWHLLHCQNHGGSNEPGTCGEG